VKHLMSKVIVVAILIFFVMPSLSPAQIASEQNEAVDSKNDFEIKYTITFSEKDLRFDMLMGYDTIELIDGGYLNEPGKPMLPLKNIVIALPEDMKAIDIRFQNVKERELPGKYTIFPAQPLQHVGEKIDEVTFVEPDVQTYKSERPYPLQVAELTDQTDIAGQSMAVVTIYPIHYRPSQRSLTLVTSIEFTIEGTKGYECGDYLPRRISDYGKEMYLNMIKESVINPEDVKLRVDDDPQPTGVDPGDFDYVIITQSSWVDDFQPLADWKTKKGVPANIVTTTWIYNEYSGTSQQKIRAFVQDAHSTWGTTYFLLGGDTAYIPYYIKYIPVGPSDGRNIPTDTYYADYDDDWICEVHVGRASVYHTGSTAGGIINFINKLLTYEKNPPLTNYAKKASLFGFDLDYMTDGEDCKIDIDNYYIPSSWTMTNVYDSHGGSHESNVKTAVNAGQNLINHIDHCGEYYIGTGDYNHGTGLSTSEVDAFYNGDKQSIFYSIGCWPAAFDYSNCIAEHFVRDANGGGVAFVGNTRYGWYQPGSDDYANLRYDRYFFRSLFSQNHYKLGVCFSDHKRDAYISMYQDDYNRYIFTELNLLGDPELPIWTEDPTQIDNVDFPSTISTGSQPFTVTVTDGGGPVNAALVCVQKNGEIYEYGITNANGQKTFTINPQTEGAMDVTVTKQNLLPYEGTTNVQDQTPPYLLDGYCTYQDLSPVNDVTVEVINLDSSLSWMANTVDNYYYLELQPGEDVYVDDVLRIIANDDVEWINVTDHTVTQNEIDTGGATADLILNEFYLDLNDFPMYQAESPYNEMCGPAVAQMALNYMWWNSTSHPSGPPMTFDDQSWLYDRGIENNSNPGDYLDLVGMWSVIQYNKPMPYNEYGYNFNKRHNADQDFMLKQICQWVNYTVGTVGGHKEGHPYHVPSIIPAYGDYTNWMAIRGIHTDNYSYPMPDELTVYGFWVNDPLPTGIGENSYKTGNEFVTTYYQQMTVGDYIGEYLAVLEPPESVENCELRIAESKPRFDAMQQFLLSWSLNIDDVPDQLQQITDQAIIQAAIDGVREQLIPYDQGFATLFGKTIPGKPLFIPSIIGNNYYAIPFNLLSDSNGGDDETVIVVLIDADDGSFKEASWTNDPITYLPLTKEEAQIIAYEFLEKLGVDIEDINDLQPELIHRDNSPYYPEWQVLYEQYGIYIKQDGTVTYIIFKHFD